MIVHVLSGRIHCLFLISIYATLSPVFLQPVDYRILKTCVSYFNAGYLLIPYEQLISPAFYSGTDDALNQRNTKQRNKRLDFTFCFKPGSLPGGDDQARHKLFPLNERFSHCERFVIRELFRRMFVKIGGRSDQNTALPAIQREFGTADGINHHPCRVW